MRSAMNAVEYLIKMPPAASPVAPGHAIPSIEAVFGNPHSSPVMSFPIPLRP